MTDLLTHLGPLALREIEADLEDTYYRLTHSSPGSTEAAHIADHLAAISEELVRRNRERLDDE